jgi:hypothetical protein
MLDAAGRLADWHPTLQRIIAASGMLGHVDQIEKTAEAKG